jgi:LacI family transcriptional regulator
LLNMSSEGKRITLQDIALSLGVSRGTVDRAIHGRGRINEETRERVIEEARRLGYAEERLTPLLALRRSLEIACIIPDRPDYFFDFILEGMQDAAQGLHNPGMELSIHRTPANDESYQARIIENLPESVDGIILVPQGMEEIGKAVRRWKSAGPNRIKPLLTVNSDLPESGRECFVGQDLYRSGRIAGEILGKLVRKGSVLPITGKRYLFGHEERIRGFTEMIREFFPGIDISEPVECSDDELLAGDLVREALHSPSPPSGIFCASGASTLGAAGALRAEGLPGIPLVGYDRSSRLMEALDDLVVDALVTQDPVAQGREAVHLLYSLAGGEPPPENGHLHTRTEVLFREL